MPEMIRTGMGFTPVWLEVYSRRRCGHLVKGRTNKYNDAYTRGHWLFKGIVNITPAKGHCLRGQILRNSGCSWLCIEFADNAVRKHCLWSQGFSGWRCPLPSMATTPPIPTGLFSRFQPAGFLKLPAVETFVVQNWTLVL